MFKRILGAALAAAMCISLAACGGVSVRILDPGCVSKTFPDYFERLAGLVKTAPLTDKD